MNTEVLDQNGDVYFMLKNNRFLSILNVWDFKINHFKKKKKKIAPANDTAEVVCIDQIIPKSTWLNREFIF